MAFPFCLHICFFHRQCSAFRIFQEAPQGGNALCFGAIQIQLLRAQGGEDHHFTPGTGYCNIQPPPTAVTVQRAKVHVNLAIFIRAKANGEQNHIPFIALNIFQVFNKQRLFCTVDPLFQLGILCAGFVQQVINEMLLGNVEGHNTKALLRQFRVFVSALDFRHNRFGFCFVCAGLATVKYTVHMD